MGKVVGTMTWSMNGATVSLNAPSVMGILNVTPDSFYAQSRSMVEANIRRQARQMADEGADIIDIGGCSTRPGSVPVTADEELKRLSTALAAVRDELPDVLLSVDTFRRDVAMECVHRFGPFIVNDVSGGDATLRGLPYVCMCPTADPISFFERRLPELQAAGIDEVILDPGFGFGKSEAENYSVLSRLEELQRWHCPVLVGVSRKSMIWRPLGVTPDEALPGTIVLHTVALQKGASILRVHDVREARQAIQLVARII